MSRNVQIVLARPQNPANIGQVARAMKNFGFSRLVLVKSVPHQTDESYTLGWKAKEIIDGAVCIDSLEAALKDSDLSIGFTRRSGRHRGKPRILSEVVSKIEEANVDQKVSLVFGNEKNGLSNEELDLCDELVSIPTKSAYGSMNLSHAVAVVAYSIHALSAESKNYGKKQDRFYATAHDQEDLLSGFNKLLYDLNYHKSPRKNLHERTVDNLHRFFQRAGLERREYRLFKALLANIHKKFENQLK